MRSQYNLILSYFTICLTTDWTITSYAYEYRDYDYDHVSTSTYYSTYPTVTSDNESVTTVTEYDSDYINNTTEFNTPVDYDIILDVNELGVNQSNFTTVDIPLLLDQPLYSLKPVNITTTSAIPDSHNESIQQDSAVLKSVTHTIDNDTVESDDQINPVNKLIALIASTYIRKPIAIVIDTVPESLRMAKLFWKYIFPKNVSLDVVLVAYNSTDVVVTYEFKNIRSLVAGIENIPNENGTSNDKMGESKAIWRAINLIPYDSAIFLCTTPNTNEYQSETTAFKLIRKRIRLYLIQFSEESDSKTTDQWQEDNAILKNIALKSGGDIFHINNPTE